MTFHWIDFFLIIILGLFALVGFVKGFTQRVFSIASWGGAIFGTFKLYPILKPLVVQYIASGTTATVLTSAILFIVLLVLLKVSTTGLSNLIHKSPLKGLDRLLGMILGIGIGAIILCLMGMIVHVFVPQTYHPKDLDRSLLWPWMIKGQHYIEELNNVQKKNLATEGLFKDLPSLSLPESLSKDPDLTEVHYDDKERSQLDTLIEKNT
jgi:uncharacterized membrane protein required for colicin V production